MATILSQLRYDATDSFLTTAEANVRYAWEQALQLSLTLTAFKHAAQPNLLPFIASARRDPRPDILLHLRQPCDSSLRRARKYTGMDHADNRPHQDRRYFFPQSYNGLPPDLRQNQGSLVQE